MNRMSRIDKYDSFIKKIKKEVPTAIIRLNNSNKYSQYIIQTFYHIINCDDNK